MNKALLNELMQLSPAERIELAMDLWDSIPAGGDAFQLTAEQKAELDRRIAEHESDPSTAISYEEVREWLWSRRK